MHDIFISYSHKDQEWVNKFGVTLVEQGYKVWWDKDLMASQDYAAVIEDALNSTQCVLTVWSKNSVKSKWVRAESARGFNQDMLIPILIEDTNIPIPYDSVHTADLRTWDGDENHKGFKDVINGIDWLLKNEADIPKPQTAFSISENVKPTSESPKKKSNVWMFAIGAFAIALAGYFFLPIIGDKNRIVLNEKDMATLAACNDKLGDKSLIKLSGRGDQVGVATCIGLKSNIKIVDVNLWTPLHAAANGNHVEIARMLVGKGANLEAKDKNERTPLYLAAIVGNYNMVDYLVEKNAVINTKDLLDFKLLERKNLREDIRKRLMQE